MNSGKLDELLDMIGAEEEDTRGMLVHALATLCVEGQPFDQVMILAGERANTIIPMVIERLGFKVFQIAPLAHLAQVKDLCEQYGKALYVLHLPMNQEVRAWVSRILDDYQAQRTYVWAITGSDEELKKAGLPTSDPVTN